VDLFSAQQSANNLMVQHGLIESGWSFAFNRRKRSLGLCRYETKRIELSVFFVTSNNEPEVRDTILHEIAHALAGHRSGHGPAWVDACRQLGATPDRICSTATMPKGSYNAQCPACDQQHNRHRRPMRGRTYYCRGCGSKRGKLQFTWAGHGQ